MTCSIFLPCLRYKLTQRHVAMARVSRKKSRRKTLKCKKKGGTRSGGGRRQRSSCRLYRSTVGRRTHTFKGTHYAERLYRDLELLFEELPEVDTLVETSDGRFGVVLGYTPNDLITVQLDDDTEVNISVNQVVDKRETPTGGPGHPYSQYFS
jgi:hypothetical protein